MSLGAKIAIGVGVLTATAFVAGMAYSAGETTGYHNGWTESADYCNENWLYHPESA